MIERRLIEIEGLVQGVGFRPFVHALATRLSLSGQVCNAHGSVAIDAEGEPAMLDLFMHELSTVPPPMAVIERIRVAPAGLRSSAGFRIAGSRNAAHDAPVGLRTGDVPRVSPDLATCATCVAELFDPANRRYRYAFLGCSDCGPRAHIASCLAEHGVEEPVIGVAFDGTGLGTDGAIWGGEILLVEGARFERLAHLSYVPLPGGDAVARHPWRAAVAHVWAAYDGDLSRAPSAVLDRFPQAELAIVRQMLPRPTLAPPSSSVGRLFDAVAALLGVRQSAQFEAQAAIELEQIADPASGRRYALGVIDSGEAWRIDAGPLVRAIAEDVAAGYSTAVIAGGFHHALAAATAIVVRSASRRTGVRSVALSGGAFQSALLARLLRDRLASDGFTVLVHCQVPCNDGGLSLGQLWIAAAHLRAGTLNEAPACEMSSCA